MLIAHCGPTTEGKTLLCDRAVEEQGAHFRVVEFTTLFFRFKIHREKRTREGAPWHLHSTGSLIDTSVQRLNIPFLKCLEAKMSELLRFQSINTDPNQNMGNPKLSQISKFFIIPDDSDNQGRCYCLSLSLMLLRGTTGS